MDFGICGLPCKLCAMRHMDTRGRCQGCKSPARMKSGCPFITCAIKNKGVEFCWGCPENPDCDRWNARRARAKSIDSVVCCHQRLEDDIQYIQKNSIDQFMKLQDRREKILIEMLENFNEGRSKRYYCVAATVMEIDELTEAVRKATEKSEGLDIKARAKMLRSILDEIAEQKKYTLKLKIKL